MSTSSSERSYVATWENFIEKDGSVFYVEYTNINEHNNSNNSNQTNSNECSMNNRNSSPRTSSKNIGDKIIRLISSTTSTSLTSSYKGNMNKNSCKKLSKRNTEQTEQNLNGKIIQIELVIPQPNNFQFKRQPNLTKLILGIETLTLPDKKLIIAGFQHNSRLGKEKSLQIGDLLMTVNKKKVTSKNIDETLSKCIDKNRILLQFRRIEKEKFNVSHITEEINNFEIFSNNFESFIKNSDVQDSDNLVKFSLIILRNSEEDDTIFCYPKKDKNLFYNAKGSFLTLISILKNEFNTEPINTTISHYGNKYILCYAFLNEMLIMIFIPTNYLTKKESNLLITHVTNFIKLSYSKLHENEKSNLESVCKIIELILINCKTKYIFEEFLQEQNQIFLPKEAQLKIVDALSEMEAMDYRDWIEEPLNSHREFFIVGSCLFYNRNLFFNSLNVSILKSLKCLLVLKGIFSFADNQIIKDFIHWSEIFLNTKNQNFLAICIKNNLVLCVVLQTFNINSNDNGNKIEPPVFYIEEIQETLDHLSQMGGIDALAKVWETLNKRPETLEQIYQDPWPNDEHDFIKTKGTSDMSTSNSVLSASNLQDESDSDEDWNGFPKNQKNSSSFDISELKKSFLKEVHDILPIVITVGKDNVLINYVQIDYGSGIIMSSTNYSCNITTATFKSACQMIHSILDKIKRSRTSVSTCNNPRNSFTIKEHGILQTIKDEYGNEKHFWIIGRLLESLKELYVCHCSDTPQNLVEIGFRLSYLTDG